MNQNREESRGLYVRLNETIEYMEDWTDVRDMWEDLYRSPTVVDHFHIGYHDYSLEFSFDGCFMYPVDRDDLDEENQEDLYFRTLDGLLSLMQSHGEQYLKLLEIIEGHVSISNYNNSDDFHVYELRETLLREQIGNCKGKTEIYTIVIANAFQIENIWSFTSESEAEAFFISKANSWYEQDFAEIDQVYEFMSSEEFMDAMFDYAIFYETVILEGA